MVDSNQTPEGHMRVIPDLTIETGRSDRPVLKVRPDQKLWESEHFMELFFSQCIEGIWFMEAREPFLWDDSIDKEKALDYAFAHQHIVKVNDAMLRQYDATREQFMGLTLNDFFAHDLDNARHMWQRIFDAGKLTCETCERRFRGGEKFAGDMVWFLGDYFCIYNADGRMVGHFGAQREITQRKLAEQALRESEERYRFLAKNVADGIIVVLNGRLMFVNDALVNLFGYFDASQLVGREVFSLIADESRERFRKMLGNFEQNGRPADIFQTVCMTREGRRFWAEGNNTVVNWNGQPAFLCTIRDINKRKLRELEAQEQAENLQKLNIKLRSSIRERFRFGNIIGKSPAMQKVYELIIRAAGSDANVVIYGESGTGKELVAQAIHRMSNRSEKAFVTVNCHAIPDTLLESEFFGHRKGAFTGAYIDKPGYLDRADGGDLFLDEVGDLDLGMQGKLLRAIDGGGMRRWAARRCVIRTSESSRRRTRTWPGRSKKGPCGKIFSIASTSFRSRCRPFGKGRGISRCWWTTSWRIWMTAKRKARSPATLSIPCSTTTGPGMCVSCRMCCSGIWRWATLIFWVRTRPTSSPVRQGSTPKRFWRSRTWITMAPWSVLKKTSF